MKETLSKMSTKLNSMEAPLAQFDDTDEWQYGDLRTKNVNSVRRNCVKHAEDGKDRIRKLTTTANNDNDDEDGFGREDDEENLVEDDEFRTNLRPKTLSDMVNNNVFGVNFDETVSNSLEDLVNTFDEKITRCFHDYQESVEKLAPVQVRSQEEIMNECQMWWTITGNFGNILPIDWSKSFSRKIHMPALNLKRRNDANETKNTFDDNDNEKNDYYDLTSEDEAIAHDLDMHSLILSGLNMDNEPVKTAEEVIREIDDIIEEETCECSPDSDMSDGGDDLLVHKKCQETLPSPLFDEKLKTLSMSQLNELYLELELLIRDYSETLITELASRDELEFEKELKNSFISLLLGVQNRRRQYHVEKKKGIRNGVKFNTTEPKYLTTVIPYHVDNGPLDNEALQVLTKILKAINEDSPTVPTLLTDYILKVLCPT